ncbi:hypothetical protein BUZ14_07385 [Staphylococcus gallinarum]|uniref:Uncharacterized protein n=1 Tax=Staphylococcus gallinarum TaxID=1293 RepID=A0A3A0W052_STAGA|nr:hypothetical protein [Staphylococcus gallinarum]RIP34986.1 hypothetical protein BUZ14_07385 [Staphylococcus gallinarum]
MIQSVNQISLYKKIDEKLLNVSGIKFHPVELSYDNLSNNDEQYIDVSNVENKEFQINEFDAMWSPSENNLRIKQTLTIDNPSKLFGDDGITCIGNVIGIAAHIHSKESGFQKTVNFDSIRNQNEKKEININYQFPTSTIRGVVHLDFFFYLKEVNDTRPYFANKSGMLLSGEGFNSIDLIIDGSGSSFPMTEFEEKDGPLWKIEQNWADPEEDTFEASNVNIALNIKHRLFPELKKETRVINQAMMMSIMTQAMSLITQQVIIIEKHDVEDEESLIPGTILSAVSYWVKTFEIDTTNIFSIQNSFMKNIERQSLEGDNND